MSQASSKLDARTKMWESEEPESRACQILYDKSLECVTAKNLKSLSGKDQDSQVDSCAKHFEEYRNCLKILTEKRRAPR